MNFEKSFLKSKKAIAFFLCVLILASMAIIALVTQEIQWPLAAFMTSIVLVIGFLGTGFIFSTAQLDKYIRLAQINKFIHPHDIETEDTPADDYFAGEESE